jgi:hypothetical protein
VLQKERFGAEEACWAHNPKVAGSKPATATLLIVRATETTFNQGEAALYTLIHIDHRSVMWVVFA